MRTALLDMMMMLLLLLLLLLAAGDEGSLLFQLQRQLNDPPLRVPQGVCECLQVMM